MKDFSLRIPEDGDWFTIPIFPAVVRRIDSQPRAFFYGLEFVQIQDTMGKQLARHIFEKQRLLLRKFGENLPFPNPF